VELLKTYYALAKPGIIYGNAVNVAAGFFLASRGDISLSIMLGVIVGSSLVMASGCVTNNFIDRGIDKKMARTKNRALVSGVVSGRSALIYAALLGFAGFAALAAYTNVLTVSIGLVGWFSYVVLYGIGKRRTVHGTLIGAISGAVPPVAGYCAVTNTFDGGALLLFLILVCWQMPHFYAIATYRFNDYAAAKIPVWPVVKGIHSAKVHMLFYIAAFAVACSALTIFGYTGYTYLVVMALVSLWWLRLAVQGFAKKVDDAKWARKLFHFSLIVTLIFSVMISINNFLF
jgi:protoheme IX farnesyltransferase